MAKGNKSEGLGISGFTLGVLSIPLIGGIGLIISIIGFIFCLKQQKQHPIKLGKYGIVLNVIGFCLSAAALIVYFAYLVPNLGSLV